MLHQLTGSPIGVVVMTIVAMPVQDMSLICLVEREAFCPYSQ